MANTINKATIKDQFRQALQAATVDAFEEWRVDNNVNSPFFGTQESIPLQLADQLADSDVDDLIEDAKSQGGKAADSILDYIPAFVQESYDADYLADQFDKLYDWDNAATNARDEAVLELSNDANYSQAPQSFWEGIVQRVPDEEVIRYANKMPDSLQSFVEQYAADWENSISEDAD